MEICSDNRFEIIAKAKEDIIGSTNIDTSPDEMAVLDNFLFRCWQMGWLKQYEEQTGARTQSTKVEIDGQEILQQITDALQDAIADKVTHRYMYGAESRR